MVQCSVDGCDGPVKSRGWCVKHYTRWLRYGDPTLVSERRRAELRVPAGFRRCADCKEVKPNDQFSPGNKRNKDGLSTYCRPCAALRHRKWQQANPEKAKAIRDRARKPRTPEQKEARWAEEIVKRYGLSAEEYEALLTAQDGSCAICDGPPNGPGKRLHVDHDHESGQVRGLLCSNCNTLIGLAKHEHERLLSAVAYLQRK